MCLMLSMHLGWLEFSRPPCLCRSAAVGVPCHSVRRRERGPLMCQYESGYSIKPLPQGTPSSKGSVVSLLIMQEASVMLIESALLRFPSLHK